MIVVDELVATCYCHKPKDGRKYKLIHKDGNMANNLCSNLEWQYVPPTPYTVNMNPECNIGSLKIKSDGTVYDGKNILTVHNELYDSDTDLFVTIRPHVSYNGKRVFMYDLVGKARYVHGDKDTMSNPLILHKDHDPMNYNRDNLEWVEKDSKEYQEFMADYNKLEYENNNKFNPGKKTSGLHAIEEIIIIKRKKGSTRSTGVAFFSPMDD